MNHLKINQAPDKQRQESKFDCNSILCKSVHVPIYLVMLICISQIHHLKYLSTIVALGGRRDAIEGGFNPMHSISNALQVVSCIQGGCGAGNDRWTIMLGSAFEIGWVSFMNLKFNERRQQRVAMEGIVAMIKQIAHRRGIYSVDGWCRGNSDKR